MRMLCILDAYALYTRCVCFVYYVCMLYKRTCVRALFTSVHPLHIMCMCFVYPVCAGLDTRYPYLVYQPCLLCMHAVFDPFSYGVVCFSGGGGGGGNLLLS